MKQDLPLVSFERDMNHNYMVLYKCDFFGAAKDNSRDYRVRMLLENKIQGLLPITHRQVNGESRYYYEINSLQPLDRLIEKNELDYRMLRTVFFGCIHLFDNLEEYLLNGEQIMMKAEFIYVNVESMEPYFACYPDYSGDVRCSFMEFVDELLAHIDHTDKQAVMLGYQVYRYTRNPNYVLSGIRKFMECAATEVPNQENCGYISEQPLAEPGDKMWDNRIINKESNAFMLQEDVPRRKEADMEEEYQDTCDRQGNIKELIGGVFCVFVAICAGAIIVGARVFQRYKLSGNYELYMYGAVAMALVAAVLFFVCYIKTVRQSREIEMLNEECEESVYEELISREVVHNLTIKHNNEIPRKVGYREVNSLTCSNETICLGNEAIEERVLRGRVNGKEVSIPLDCLPLTVGKLGGVSDFIINDNAVSKMHARIEEHNGKVCVCDLNSTNGTVHNGEVIAIHTPVVLEQGDTLRFGRSCFTYY
ncbi:hypothetical protein C809_01574 [Lachnospiraceae bacterium MD335]|nr:hypothetical protein C809_01574 [Lachnospiraceae bacterium MD335]